MFDDSVIGEIINVFSGCGILRKWCFCDVMIVFFIKIDIFIVLIRVRYIGLVIWRKEVVMKVEIGGYWSKGWEWMFNWFL